MLSSNLSKLVRQGHLKQAKNFLGATWNTVSTSTNKGMAWTAVELDKDPKELRAKWPKPTFNVEKLTEIIDHDNHEMRKEMREFLSDPVMRAKFNISLAEEREVSVFISIYIISNMYQGHELNFKVKYLGRMVMKNISDETFSGTFPCHARARLKLK